MSKKQVFCCLGERRRPITYSCTAQDGKDCNFGAEDGKNGKSRAEDDKSGDDSKTELD